MGNMEAKVPNSGKFHPLNSIPDVKTRKDPKPMIYYPWIKIVNGVM